MRTHLHVFCYTTRVATSFQIYSLISLENFMLNIKVEFLKFNITLHVCYTMCTQLFQELFLNYVVAVVPESYSMCWFSRPKLYV